MFDTFWIARVLQQDCTARLDINGFCVDSREVCASDCFVGLSEGQRHGSLFAHDAYERGVRVFILEKGSLDWKPALAVVFWVANTLNALHQLARAQRERMSWRVVGITGSSGKTSTREMLAEALRARYRVFTSPKNWNNHIGLPLTLLSVPQNCDAVLVEMGMNHAGEIRVLSQLAQPNIVVITNIGLAHVEHLGSRAHIARAKAEIFEGMHAEAVAVLPEPEEDAALQLLQSLCPVQAYTFSSTQITVREDLAWRGMRLQWRNETFHFPLMGRHQLSNLAAVLTVGEILGVPAWKMTLRLANIRPVSERMEYRTWQGIHFIHDAYNANPESMRAALECLASMPSTGRHIAVLGAILELGAWSDSEHRTIGCLLTDMQDVSYVFVFGEEARGILRALPDQKGEYVANMPALLERLHAFLEPGDWVLVKASHGTGLWRFRELWEAETHAL